MSWRQFLTSVSWRQSRFRCGRKKLRGSSKKGFVKRFPLFCFVSSGGARMQEGIMSLMQCRKYQGPYTIWSRRGSPISVFWQTPLLVVLPTSMGMLGDIIIAEPKAMIGFWPAPGSLKEQSKLNSLRVSEGGISFGTRYDRYDIIKKRIETEIAYDTLFNCMREINTKDPGISLWPWKIWNDFRAR